MITESQNNMLNWKNIWQRELVIILGVYQFFRNRNPLFFLYLLAFFFLVNSICYWLAIAASFPELINEQLLRMFKIQLPVALMGGLFDSLSFFVTIWLIRYASKASSGTKLVGILSLDLLIAAVATAWVLLVVIVSSWLIGPPELSAIEKSRTNVMETPSLQKEKGTDKFLVDNSTKPSSKQIVKSQPMKSKNIIVDELDAKTERNTSFYQNVLVDALRNPLGKLSYFIFGIIMGISTLLPTALHILMAFRSLLLPRKQRHERLIEA